MITTRTSLVIFTGASITLFSAMVPMTPNTALSQTTNLTPVQNNSAQLTGTWVREKSDAATYQKITLVLRADGTYTKTLVARVNGAPYGGAHNGTWSARGSVVSLSGDGNWPPISHDLAEFRREE